MGGFSVNDALGRSSNMGQQLFEPPDVAGWDLGPGWFSSGAMLTRMNFASQLATNQKFNLRDIARGQGGRHRRRLLSLVLDRLTPAPFARDPYQRAARLRARRHARGPAPMRSLPSRPPALRT